ncbi:FAD-dependent oxidoreductase [Burkholderia vietnamiensis]|uniref:FAD-dependent oxidoreductase n=1 Tax=Burkholderia vietnamiensis TaxID=60552 RepID=A0AAW7SVV8_BURVI|nr:FAD-dependent oxidoreductase [Burkholderia vietnamiensis]MBH9645852.1 FAD-dependent oxidoreductase [Burkholderia vietnamiensis]MBR8008839.1 FAD-dependent oxidoreductase [Burkholderia vietnamiensis]MDN7551302.1 FAD-dependent oxidoreductase [Burkholderia vietnamiensis]MDN7795116.1 FAD-dependent oxidoreductase [Burkholderia vietnamiensis]MDN8044976.1 FAD-dependent oxidoreductase [Burkholderia vietnamiensis]
MDATISASSISQGPVVVLGAGHAGCQFALALRQAGYRGALTLVDKEEHLPYQKPPLSKGFLTGTTRDEALRVKSDHFYVEHDIARKSGHVTRLDRIARHIHFADGTSLPYAHLVLAPGAVNRQLGCPGEGLEGVYSLRNLDDARRLREALVAGRQAVVIGAGFIGLEFSASARALGLSVHVIDTASRPMQRAVSAMTANVCQDEHACNGVSFKFDAVVTEIAGQHGRVCGVRCSDGTEIAADLVLVAVGVTPEIELASQAGLNVSNGILVDDLLTTSDPDISAIGDAASFPYAPVGERIRLESVQNSIEQARTVASRLMGRPRPFAFLPSFWSDQGTLKLQITGITRPADDAIRLSHDSQLSFSTLLFRNGRLEAVESLNRPSDQLAAKRILAQTIRPEIDEVHNPGFDLTVWASNNQST